MGKHESINAFYKKFSQNVHNIYLLIAERCWKRGKIVAETVLSDAIFDIDKTTGSKMNPANITVAGEAPLCSENYEKKNMERACFFYRRERFEIQCSGLDEATGEKDYVIEWQKKLHS